MTCPHRPRWPNGHMVESLSLSLSWWRQDVFKTPILNQAPVQKLTQVAVILSGDRQPYVTLTIEISWQNHARLF